MEKAPPIRSVRRALEILRVINRMRAPTLTEIARATDLPYPTAFRIVQTLVHEGVIEQERFRKRYRPTELVRSLASGFQDDDRLVAAAQANMQSFTAEHLWPLALSVRVGNRMMIKHATHKMTSQTFINYFPGDTMPLLDCASGRAMLAFCDDEERATVLSGLQDSRAETDSMGLQIMCEGGLLEQIKGDGYATMARTRFTELPGKTSAMAVPVFHDGKLVATLTLIFFANAMTMEEAVQKYLEPLGQLSQRVAASM